MQKYSLVDARDILERASARETAARVAAGTLAKALLAELDISLVRHVIQMGSARSKSTARPTPPDLSQLHQHAVRRFPPPPDEALLPDLQAYRHDAVQGTRESVRVEPG